MCVCVCVWGGGAEVTKSKGEQSHICLIFIDPRLMIGLPAYCFKGFTDNRLHSGMLT